MRTLFDGEINVAYSQLYVESRRSVSQWSPDANFAGQNNGLCGARVHGSLWLTTGLHTGTVPLTVELHEQSPEIDPSWEDVVEASFWADTDSVRLVEWGGGVVPLADLTRGEYRVRYSGRGLDAANEQDVRLADEPEVDRYLLQFWRNGLFEDAVVKQTASFAEYWHRYARTEAADRALQAARKPAPQAGELDQWHDWGGSRPSDRLLDLGSFGQILALADRGLLDAIETATPDLQRQIAAWSARRACEMAGVADIEWIATAVAALHSGRPLPASFDDGYAVYSRFSADDRVPQDVVDRSLNGSGPGVRSESVLPALFCAVDTDPLRAAVLTTFHAGLIAGPGCQDFFDELRETHFASSR